MNKRMKRFARILSLFTIGVMLLNTACSKSGDVSSSDSAIGSTSILSSESLSESVAESLSESLSESVAESLSESLPNGDHVHVWGDYTIVNFSCEEGGRKKRKCLTCLEEEYGTIPAGHALLFAKEIPATCKESGWEAGYYCANCDYNERKPIVKSDHNFVNGVCINDGCDVQYEDSDTVKTVISVATYDGGAGYAWLQEAIARFEKMYENVEFEPGKVGVKVNLDHDKSRYLGYNLENKALDKDVYFTEGVDYYSFVNMGKVADISDVVTGDMSYYNEKGTIEAKLDDSVKSFLTAKDGKYYMLPFFDGVYGFTYDVELFEERGFYFDDKGSFIRLSSFDSREDFEKAKSNGPDGKPLTYDDGLPATYQQIIMLCEYIAMQGCIPICYAGFNDFCVNRAMLSYAADYEGYEAFSLNYTFNGNGVKLIKNIDDNGVLEFEYLDIRQDNGFELARQAGKYYALKMQEELFGSNKYVGSVCNSYDYKEAQAKFVASKYNEWPYAMLVEGVWWENEAKDVFEMIESVYGEGRADRRFGFMPIPKASIDMVGEQTMFSTFNSFGFINKDCANMGAAKEFLKFLHTNIEMSKFSLNTSMTRSLNYKMYAEDLGRMTSFGKSVIAMRENSKVVYPYSSLDLVMGNPNYFSLENWYFNGNSPFVAFKDGVYTAVDYFDNVYLSKKGSWQTL